MKAMLLRATGPIETAPLEAADLPLPEPGPGQIRVKVQVCGICHTDLHTVEGDLPLPKLPLVPGHQVVGVVEQVGPGVSHLRTGDPVGMPWLHSTCGVCQFCRTEQENLCPNATFTGLQHHGGYAQHTLAEAMFAEPLPPALAQNPMQVAPLLCGGIIGYRALRVCGLRPGERLGLYGFGASAHVAIQVARFWGCKVFVFSRSQEHLALAEKLGACFTGQPHDPSPEALHRAINFTPAGSLILPAMENLIPGGTLAMAGIYVDQIPALDYQKHLYYEKRLCSVANSTRRDAAELLRLAAEIPIQTDVCEFPLEQANLALQQLKGSQLPAGAAVLRVA